MKTLASFSAMAVAFALSTAAVSAQQASTDVKPAAAKQVMTQVQVTNHNWLDADVYLDNGGVLQRLGFVVSEQTAQFTIPEHALSSGNRLRLVALPVGSTSAYVSPDLLLVRGDAITMTVENQIGLSSTFMRATAD